MFVPGVTFSAPAQNSFRLHSNNYPHDPAFYKLFFNMESIYAGQVKIVFERYAKAYSMLSSV